MEVLNQILAHIPAADAPILSTIAIVLEFALRLIPSAKPLSIMHLVGRCIRLAGAICLKAADLLDKVLPQKIATKEEG